ncbi:MAG: aminotransferase class IV [Spirochaetales bacterium]|nr:aminotransferase class IV [Spirochaetales bacterium]
MPCLIRHISLTPIADAQQPLPPDRFAENLTDASRFESETGVYAVFATWHGHRVVCLSKHFDRLEDSASRAGFSLTLNRRPLQDQLRKIARDSGFGEVRMRISASPQSSFLTVSVEPYHGPPADLRERGVRCKTVAHAPRSNPRAKQTRWLLERSELGTTNHEVYEQLLVDQSGCILEGVSSNFYVVRRAIPRAAAVPGSAAVPGDMVLQTADAGILPGIARAIVMEVARDVIAVDLAAPRLNERSEFAEAFLTSASRGIVPIMEIDGQPIGTGGAGEITRTLIEHYDRRAQALEEAL